MNNLTEAYTKSLEESGNDQKRAFDSFKLALDEDLTRIVDRFHVRVGEASRMIEEARDDCIKDAFKVLDDAVENINGIISQGVMTAAILDENLLQQARRRHEAATHFMATGELPDEMLKDILADRQARREVAIESVATQAQEIIDAHQEAVTIEGEISVEEPADRDDPADDLMAKPLHLRRRVA